ncbi:MAG TPA: VOC family protein [Chitinophagaceae bacterium]|nr:VOC family protein [Chitinophagaceae bacterium]
MDIDHIFIFTNTEGKIADELISFGLTANESRVHKGQGTMNRTFSFENFFLEIAWVHNEQEIKSDLVKPTGLWQRAEYFKNNYSPFGLIILNNKESDQLFENAYRYQPEYFQSGMAFDILQNSIQPDLPWTCRMPFRREENTEPLKVNHKNKICLLTKATFNYCGSGSENLVDQFNNEKTIRFLKSDRAWLTLTFDNCKQGLKKIFEPLKLTIDY